MTDVERWGDSPQHAAVLMPLVQDEQHGSGWSLLYIQRSEQPGDPHSGQVAFPGGRVEAEDVDPRATALREAQEEVGLLPQDLHVVGQLDPVPTGTNYLVVPVVASLRWPVPLTLQESEVARVFTLPLSWLSDPANVERREWRTGVSSWFFKRRDGAQLWGASAAMTLRLIEAIDSGAVVLD